jgi:peptide/nickel transport system substrate-binding protein
MITKVEAPDDYTAEIYTNSVNYMFYTSLWGCPIVPKNYIETNGDEYFNEHPIGSGPWKFVKLTSGVSVEFEAVPNHWRITPSWGTLLCELVPEQSTRVAKLKRGEVDIADVNLDQAVQVRDQGFGLRTLGRPTSPVIAMLGTWATDGPTSDIRVRQALSMAINRQEIADTFFNGLAIPGGVVWTAPVSWGYDPTWVDGPWFKYDPDQAKALLADAGYPDNFSNPKINKLSHATQSWLPDLNQIIASYWEAVGVQTEIQNIDGGVLRGEMYGGGDAAIWGDAATWNMPTMQVSIPFLSSALVSTGNWQLLHDPDFDALWGSITKEPDPQKQIALFRDTVEYFLNQYVVPGVVNIPTYYAVGPGVGDWTIRNSYDIGGALAGIKKQ